MAQPIATPILSPAVDTRGGFADVISHTCFFGGFASIAASIAAWVFFRAADPAPTERFAIFIGLWAPTFFALSDRLDRYARAARR